MKLSDGLSLVGLMLVVVLLLHAARHGPIQPIYERMSPRATTPAVIEPVPMVVHPSVPSALSGSDTRRAGEPAVARRTH